MSSPPFKQFNQALLANYCWRLLTNPDCLLAEVLKARYHPYDHFLDAQPGSRPSWGWQSLLHGRFLLLQGLRRQIGDGSSTRVLVDPWLELFTNRIDPNLVWLEFGS
ncbi:hypothetical protein LINGRAHAP2_LOCUS20766 [Linum grandiflorum]